MKKSTLGLAVIAAIPMFSSVQVLAADEAAKSIEKIQVTGSRIKRSDMETASPVTLIGADEIRASGATSVDSVLQQMTATGGAMTNPGVNNGSGGNASINLRGLGSARTLVLVNGRRMINSGTGAASTVDLNTIPVSMIKQIEVLKDGASAVYGTDAVAGVVNIILKNDFEGLDLNVNTAMTSKHDATENSIDFTVGTSFDKGNIVFGAQYTNRGEASQSNRDFSSCPILEDENGLYCGGSSFSEGGHIQSNVTTGILNKKNEIEQTGVANDSGLSGLGGSLHRYSTAADAYNYASSSYLYTPMNRLNITGLGTYELSDDTSFFSEFTYTKRWSEQQLAPQPINFAFDYDPSTMGDSLLGQTYDKREVANNAFVKDADGKYVTTATNYAAGDPISYRRRMSESGTRNYSQTVDTVRIVVGAEGVINDYSWDISANFGRNDSVSKTSNLHNVSSLTADVEAGTFNPLSEAAWAQSNVSQYIYKEQESGGSQLFIVSGSLSGEMFELPAGYAAFAAGVEHRQEKAWQDPDSIAAQGLGNDPRIDPTSGGFNVDEAYVEFAIPLLADAPFAESVELSAAIRAFDYSTFGSDNTWKLGLTWRATDELMMRAVRSTAFRAPTVDELYSGKAISYDGVTYPGADDQAEVTVGGNAALTPEEADTLTFGVVYEPQWLDGFSMTVDYYDIEIENAISTYTSQFVVDQCINPNGTGTALCENTGAFVRTDGRIVFNNQLRNIGSEKTSGIDLNLKYSFDALGLAWKTGLDTTYLDEYVVDTGAVIDYQGYITNGSGGYADIKSNLHLTVSGDSWDATYEARYVAGMDSFTCRLDQSECVAPTTPSIVYHDISGSYMINDVLTVSAGINNMFDKEPPYYTGNYDSNTDPYTYDTLGRRLFAGINIKL
ncbi:TonB-dependent receptor [Pseudoalteromonas sp. SWXJ133]|uniref:TonB-dependent receptor n=1 Tax=Pseudoalteromonas sp. SWXJ133 TaxID=2792069 RepID=UPI0018CEDFCB|nr:TonB-dependent receptor [Pseudoalteromonas sp. SWXJ133]MBH0021527.1 TonB-dependent receptor [Pseudoalteromonas sp. SWXJ133]